MRSGYVVASVRVPAEVVYLRAALVSLVAMNELWLATHPRTPALYSAGVRYVREKRPREQWDMVPFVLARRNGDCEDLAAWRAAELRRAGERATADVVRTGPTTLHAVVRRADGTIEDPSVKLGMRRPRRITEV